MTRSAATSIRAELRPFERRRAAVAFVRALLPSIPVAFVFALMWSAQAGREITVSLLGAALVVAISASVLWTWWRIPSSVDTATKIDEALQSADCITAAWGLHEPSDSIAALVVRDARRHLGRTSPAAVFPWGLRPYAIASLSVIALAVAISTAINPPSSGAGVERLGASALSDSGAVAEGPTKFAPGDRRAAVEATKTGAASAGLMPVSSTDAPDSSVAFGRSGPTADFVATDEERGPFEATGLAAKSDDTLRSERFGGRDATSTALSNGVGQHGGGTSIGASSRASGGAGEGIAPAGAVGTPTVSANAAGGVSRGTLTGSSMNSAGEARQLRPRPSGERALTTGDASWRRSAVPPARRQFVSDYFARLRALYRDKQ